MNQSKLSNQETIIRKICDFLHEIGIPTEAQPLNEDAFLPGILISKGKLIYDKDKLLEPGDLLHEAGHIALMNKSTRVRTTGNVMENRGSHENDEIGVILWSYAALKHLELKPEVVFHNRGYHSDSKWLVEQLESGNYLGLPLLEFKRLTDKDTFPNMHAWMA